MSFAAISLFLLSNTKTFGHKGHKGHIEEYSLVSSVNFVFFVATYFFLSISNRKDSLAAKSTENTKNAKYEELALCPLRLFKSYH